MTLNESNADYIKGNKAIFVEKIQTDEEVFLQSSCVFLSGIDTRGALTTQYDLLSVGDVRATNLFVKGTFTCLADVEAEAIEVDGAMNVVGDVRCGSLLAGSDMQVGELFCRTLDAKATVVVRNVMDVQEEARAAKQVVCLDGIQCDGCIATPVLVANHFAEIEYSRVETTIVLAEMDGLRPSLEAVDVPSISDAQPEDVFDYESTLAVHLEQTSSFIEHFQQTFAAPGHPKTLADEVRLLEAYASYLDDYEIIYALVSAALNACELQDLDGEPWVDGFLAILKLLMEGPGWMEGSDIMKRIETAFAEYLQQLIARRYSTASASKWASCLSGLQELRKKKSLQEDLRQNIQAGIDYLFSCIGLKDRAIQIYLPYA